MNAIFNKFYLQGSHIAVGTALGPVEIWDVQKSKRVRKMRGHSQRVG